VEIFSDTESLDEDLEKELENLEIEEQNIEQEPSVEDEKITQLDTNQSQFDSKPYVDDLELIFLPFFFNYLLSKHEFIYLLISYLQDNFELIATKLKICKLNFSDDETISFRNDQRKPEAILR